MKIKNDFFGFLWAVPAITAIHNLEETIGMKWSLASGAETLIVKDPGFLGKIFPPSQEQFMIAALIIDIIAFAICIKAWRTRSNKWAQINLIMLMILFQSGLTQFIWWIQHFEYQPGLVTGSLLAIPAAIYFFRWALRDHYLGLVSFSYIFLIATFVHPLLNYGALFAGWAIAAIVP